MTFLAYLRYLAASPASYDRRLAAYYRTHPEPFTLYRPGQPATPLTRKVSK